MNDGGIEVRGPFTVQQARADGLHGADLERLTRTKHLVQLRRGVYVAAQELAEVTDDDCALHAMHVRALQLAYSAPLVAAASSAARIYGLEFRDPPHPDLVVLSGDRTMSGTRRDGYRLRVANLPDQHVTERHGVRLTTPARTVLDLCAELPFAGGVVIAESAIRRRLVTVDELQAIAATVPSRRGITSVRTVFDFLGPVSESPLESASRAAMRELGIAPPLTQVEFVIGGRLIRVDFYWEDLLVVGEADGFSKYAARPGQDSVAAIREEKLREQLLLEGGREVVRWGWHEVRSPALLDRRLQAAFLRGLERRRGRSV